jgi:(p)ppGpp synthase/HD superfamily hydrolase
MTPEQFATHWHGDQVRKYTGEPYIEHCREIVEILKGVPHTEDMLAAAWLHDVLEDTECPMSAIAKEFGLTVLDMVYHLTDCDKSNGNRAKRKAIDRERLGAASAEVQTIKLADLISNTKSIVEHDPKFAKVYLAEARMLLDVVAVGGDLEWQPGGTGSASLAIGDVSLSGA